jgi:hypothetical protein
MRFSFKFHKTAGKPADSYIPFPAYFMSKLTAPTVTQAL